MKKSLLALAVAALSAATLASTASATTVYDKDGTTLGFHGRVQSVLYSGKASGVTDEQASINTSGRLGIDLRTQLTPGVAGFAMAEWELANGNNSADEASGFINRLMWVGLDFGKFGSVKIGKFEESIKYAIAATDVFDDWGCTGLMGNDDRREGVVQYQWSGYGVNALVSYAFAKDAEHLDGAYFTTGAGGEEYVDIDYSVSAAIGYTTPDIVFGPIDIRAGYIHGQMNDKGVNNVVTGFGTYDDYNQYALGVSWGKLNIGPYIAALYQQRDFGIKVASGAPSEDYSVKGYEFAVGYSFANGVNLRAGYNCQKLDFDQGGDVEGKTIPVYANWSISPNVQVWAEARFDAGTDDDNLTTNPNGKNFNFETNGVYNSAENVYSAGIRYNF